MKDIKLRIAGVFFGQLVGDALGTRYEFKKKKSIALKLKDDIVNGKLNILGGGPFNVYAGQYTDDSELALGIWYSILENDGYDIDHIAKQFYLWYKSLPFDVGNATRNAFEIGTSRLDMLENAKSNSYSLSNGCLMKISPIGVLNYLTCNAFNTAKMAKEVCELTNPHPVCVDMCICYVKAIEIAIKTGDYKKAYSVACNTAETQIVKMILDDAYYRNTRVKLLDSSGEISEVDTDGSFQGYAGIAFQNAFYNILHAKSFDEVMINTISLGGDTDTNACIAGALYGACFGGNSIRKELLDSVMNYCGSKNRIELYPAINHQCVFNMLKKKLKTL